ncbi:MAG: hypothetical protein ABID87_06910 [Chloroflexota bacterium]
MKGLSRVGIIIVVGLGVLAAALAGFRGAREEENTMNAASEPTAGIPPMDMNVPVKFATATFALG